MATSLGSSSSLRIASSSLCCSHHPKRNSKLSISWQLFHGKRSDSQRLNHFKGQHNPFAGGSLSAKARLQNRSLVLLATSEDQVSNNEPPPDVLEQEEQHRSSEGIPPLNSPLHFVGSEGKPGYISFYGRPYRRQEEAAVPLPSKKQSNLLFVVGPTVLVASFIVPSLYLRRVLSSIFEDSLLTDFLILFFTEALFYCGVAVFLLLVDRLKKPTDPQLTPKSDRWQATQLVHRISSVASLVLSLIIPMVTMGLVWPWTGPAASATLAPFLVGIVVQFAFERYAKYRKSPSWTVIPIIFQVYRLHQLNRASQLVTALSFTVRGAEATAHNLAINGSLATLLNVLQFLGVICLWSLASFLMRFFPSSASVPES